MLTDRLVGSYGGRSIDPGYTDRLEGSYGADEATGIITDPDSKFTTDRLFWAYECPDVFDALVGPHWKCTNKLIGPLKSVFGFTTKIDCILDAL